MASEQNIDLRANYCKVRIRVYLKADGSVGRVFGPDTEGENGFRVIREEPGSGYQLIGVYDITGSFIPYFPPKLPGQIGIDRWLGSLKERGFLLNKLFLARRMASDCLLSLPVRK